MNDNNNNYNNILKNYEKSDEGDRFIRSDGTTRTNTCFILALCASWKDAQLSNKNVVYNSNICFHLVKLMDDIFGMNTFFEYDTLHNFILFGQERDDKYLKSVELMIFLEYVLPSNGIILNIFTNENVLISFKKTSIPTENLVNIYIKNEENMHFYALKKKQATQQTIQQTTKQEIQKATKQETQQPIKKQLLINIPIIIGPVIGETKEEAKLKAKLPEIKNEFWYYTNIQNVYYYYSKEMFFDIELETFYNKSISYYNNKNTNNQWIQIIK
jgi:hypothetical protein